MSGRLQDARAVVTGAASGLGEAAARRYHAEGASVVLADIDLIGAQRVAAELGDRATAIACDISKEEDCLALVSAAEAFFGTPVTLFHANAGTAVSGPLLEMEADRITRAIGINLTGAVFSAKAALGSLIKAGDGCLLFTSSLQGVIARPRRSIYTATKHAITGLVKSLALEFAENGVRVNALAPIGIDTPLLRQQLARTTDDVEARLRGMAENLPLGRMPTPRDFTDAAVFLASGEARCITGQTLVIDCGASAGIRDPRPA
jgi:3-oxoacyl-[acyl-carrier protein] reductase